MRPYWAHPLTDLLQSTRILTSFSPALPLSSLTIIIFQTQRQWAYLPVIRLNGRLLSRFARLDDLVDLKISIGNSDHYPTGVFDPSHIKGG